MVKLTSANLLAESATLLTLRRKREITAKQYAKRKQNLLDEQDYIDFQKEQAIKEAKRVAKETERKAKAAAKRKAAAAEKKALASVGVVFNKRYDGSEDAFVYQIWKASSSNNRLVVGNRIDKNIKLEVIKTLSTKPKVLYHSMYYIH
jgi:hypothetical protein